MTTYVLVHGAWLGAWAWHEVVPRLESAGHEVVAVDLPAHGVDTTPPGSVTLDDYVGRVVGAVDSADEPVVLVGHSAGGVTIGQTAERVPESVESLVYVAAFLLDDGQSLLDLVEEDEDAAVEQVVDEERGVSTLEPGSIEAAFYADCSAADVTLAELLLRPEPLAPIATPVDVSDERFGSVPRAYVRCAADRAITPSNQELMLEGLPCDAIYEMETGHAPFFADPETLTEHLLAVPDDVA